MAYFQDTATGHVMETAVPQYWAQTPGYERMTDKAGRAARAEQSRAKLLRILKPGDTVYTVLRHVSASGMSRRIDLYVFRDNAPVYLSAYASDITGYKLAPKGGGLAVTGCGMDMGFSVVQSLGQALWPDGTPESHIARNGEPDTAGGYALNHAWL